MRKNTKYKIKKFIKKYIINIITILISIIGIIISIISLNDTLFQSRNNILPCIMLESANSTIVSYESTTYYLTRYLDNWGNKLKIVNLGNGTAKNIKLVWNEENTVQLKKIIELLDKENKIEIKEEYPFISYSMIGSVGGFNISKKNYHKNVDYILPEKDSKLEQYILIPTEYLIYIEIICNLVSNYSYDINEIIDNIVLYLDMEYEDINQKKYNKTISLKLQIEKTTFEMKTHKEDHYFLDIINV